MEDEIGKKIWRSSSTTEISSSNTSCTSNISQMGRRISFAPPGTCLNTITPCAACKLLRRRCAEECPFSPYFSPHEPQKFAAVHKVFGASNVSKLLMVLFFFLITLTSFDGINVLVSQPTGFVYYEPEYRRCQRAKEPMRRIV